MRTVVCAFVAAFLALTLTPVGASAADRVYWSNGNGGGPAAGIASANLDGTDGHALGSVVDGVEGLALDPVAARVYYRDDQGGVSSVGLDGSSPVVLLGRGVGALGVAVDPVNRLVYFSSPAIFKQYDVSIVNLDGSGYDHIAQPLSPRVNVAAPTGIAVEPVAGRVYWTNTDRALAQPDNSLSTTDLVGRDGHDLTPVPRAMGSVTVKTPKGIAVDPVHGRIYWSNATGVISSARLDGTDAFDLPIDKTKVTLVDPQGLAVDPFGGRVYWTSDTSDAVSSANLDGSDARDIPIGDRALLDRPSYLFLSFVPRPAGMPVVSGGPRPGSVLSCSSGAWAPDVVGSFLYESPQRFSYQWSRNGSDLAGATQSTLRADATGAYRCRVTASNAAGDAAQTSDAHAVVRDTTAPRLSGVSLSHARFRVGKARTAVVAATRSSVVRGTVLRFASSEAGRLSIAIQRVRPGKRAKHGKKTLCIAVRRPVKRGGCTLLVRAATLTRTIRAGRGSVALSGRIGVKPMAAGSYRLTVTVRDAAGNASKPVRLSFTILSG